MRIYHEDFKDQDSMLRDFRIEASALDGARVIYAEYTYENYDGSAFVLFEKDGKLYEVHGSHCSCYGLEDHARSYLGSAQRARASQRKPPATRGGSG